MKALLYCIEDDNIYLWDGWHAETRRYHDQGGYIDENGQTFSVWRIPLYGSYQDAGFIKLDTVGDEVSVRTTTMVGIN